MEKNNKIASLSKLLLSTLILVYSTIIQFSMPSIVLCFGDDGHIAFEQAGENNQCDHDDQRDHPIHKHKNLAHQGNECQDLPLMTVSSILYLEKDVKIKTVKLTFVSARLNTKYSNLVPHKKLDREVTIVKSSIKSLQSTILLI